MQKEKSILSLSNNNEVTKLTFRLLIFGSAFLIRFILFQSSNITEILGSRVEIVTPVTSFTRRKVYNSIFFISLTYIMIDLLLAYLLTKITYIKQYLYKDFPRIEIELENDKPKEIDPWVVAGLYPSVKIH